MTRLPAALLLAACAALLGGCANDIVASAGAAPTQAYVYQLAPDDRLRLTVYGEPSLSGPYVVNADGDVSLPLAGAIHAAGLTLTQLNAAVTAALNKSLVDPKVAIDLLSYRPIYVLGEVNRAGQYSYHSGMTVLSAVATAGGFTYRANLKTVMIRHPGGAGEQRLPLRADQIVYPGDTIRIRERYF